MGISTDYDGGYTKKVRDQFSVVGIPSLVAFFAQLSISLIQYARNGLLHDEATYFRYGLETAEAILTQGFAATTGFSDGKQLFIWIVALSVLVFGESPIPIFAMNAFLMASLPPLSHLVTRQLGFVRSGSLTGWLFAIAPPFLLWGPGLTREPVSYFLLMVFLLGIARLTQQKFFSAFLLAGGSLLALSVTRSLLVAVCVVCGLVAISVTQGARWNSSKQPTRNLLTGTFLVIAGVALALLNNLGSLVTEAAYRNLGIGVAELSDSRLNTAVPGVSWEFNSSGVGFLFNLLRVFLGPLPWEVTNSSLLFFWVETLWYLSLFVILSRALIRLAEHRGPLMIVAAGCIALAVGSAIIMGNYGLTSRIKSHALVFLLLSVEPYFKSTYIVWNSGHSRTPFENPVGTAQSSKEKEEE